MHTLNAYMILRDGKPWLIGGTPGGDQQTQWSTQVITNVVDNEMSLQDAVDMPRWYSFPGTDPANLDRSPAVRVEQGAPQASLQGLADRGHAVERLAAYSGGGAVQLIELDSERSVPRGASDPRPGGAGWRWGFSKSLTGPPVQAAEWPGNAVIPLTSRSGHRIKPREARGSRTTTARDWTHENSGIDFPIFILV